MTEDEFRSTVRGLVAAGRYPDHRHLSDALGRPGTTRSGLSVEQGRWRREELEAAGYDWEASKSSRQLVKR